MKALIITHAAVTIEQAPIEEWDRLRWTQRTVGGYVEAVSPRPMRMGDSGKQQTVSWVLFCNEDAKVIGLPHNPQATELAVQAGWSHQPGDYLAGPVIFLGTNGVEVTDVPEPLLELARQRGLIA